MKIIHSHAVIALFAGAILAVMIQLNAKLAGLSSPLEASWIAHGLGAISAFILLQLIMGLTSLNTPKTKHTSTKNVSPWYAYLGGLPGACTVILAAITVNSSLGLAGTLAFALLGQILFSLLVDHFAWFGVQKRTINWHDISIIGLILVGSLCIIFARKLA